MVHLLRVAGHYAGSAGLFALAMNGVICDQGTTHITV